MTIFDPKLAEIVQRDPRYAYEAYEFMDRALQFTQKRLGRERTPDVPAGDPRLHVRGRELVAGLRDLALIEFGMLARTVFSMWGIRGTEDFGHIVFNLIEAGLMSRSDDDSLSDFVGVFDFNDALSYDIALDEAH
jgi:uncharacterized repeat protein (TIGR04138 family)